MKNYLNTNICGVCGAPLDKNNLYIENKGKYTTKICLCIPCLEKGIQLLKEKQYQEKKAQKCTPR